MEPTSVELERLSLNNESDFKIEFETIGDQNFPLLILDNLYRDPEYVRSLALSLETTRPKSSHPGLSSEFRTDISSLLRLAWKYVGKELGYTPELTVSRSVFPGMSFMRINRKPEDLTIHQCRPHADPVRIAGVVYLNPPEQCVGGTAFYRHRATGVEECVLPRNKNDSFEQEFMKLAKGRGVFQGYQTYCQKMFRMPYMEFVRSVLTTLPRTKNYPTDSDDDWEMTRQVEMKFNRFICYPGFMIHSSFYRDDWFGDAIEEQRLTQNVFVG